MFAHENQYKINVNKYKVFCSEILGTCTCSHELVQKHIHPFRKLTLHDAIQKCNHNNAFKDESLDDK